jgi:hypothetical protein
VEAVHGFNGLPIDHVRALVKDAGGNSRKWPSIPVAATLRNFHQGRKKQLSFRAIVRYILRAGEDLPGGDDEWPQRTHDSI